MDDRRICLMHMEILRFAQNDNSVSLNFSTRPKGCGYQARSVGHGFPNP
jgi:hypothetical protein